MFSPLLYRLSYPASERAGFNLAARGLARHISPSIKLTKLTQPTTPEPTKHRHETPDAGTCTGIPAWSRPPGHGRESRPDTGHLLDRFRRGRLDAHRDTRGRIGA